MNAIAEQFAERDVGSIFLYTHEAHPGETVPHLTSMEQKVAHATMLRDELGVSRPILVDALDGACHRAYGTMPNMTWIMKKGGMPIYKSDWTDARSVETALEYALQIVDRRRSRARLAPFKVERIDYRENDRERFFEGLARNGPKAVREYREFIQRREQQETAS